MIRAQEEEQPVVDGDVAPEVEVEAEFIIDFLDALPPGYAVAIALGAALVIGSLLFFTVRTIGRSGEYSPPIVTVIIVLGVVLLSSILVLALRPELTELIPVIAAGLGGLAAAVAVAFERDGSAQASDDEPPNPEPQQHQPPGEDESK